MAAVYNLGLLSFSDEDSLLYLGESRDQMQSRLRENVERGLARLNITTTHSLSSLQTLLLHIVRG